MVNYQKYAKYVGMIDCETIFLLFVTGECLAGKNTFGKTIHVVIYTCALLFTCNLFDQR